MELTIVRGDTFNKRLTWCSLPVIAKAITAISKGMPMVITCPDHGMLDGHFAGIVSAKGMSEANALKIQKGTGIILDPVKVKVIDANTVQFLGVNSSDFGTHTANTGLLQYNTPVNMAAMAAKMELRDKIDGTIFHTLTTENNGIVLDNVAKDIVLLIPKVQTALFTLKAFVTDISMYTATTARTLELGSVGSVVREATK